MSDVVTRSLTLDQVKALTATEVMRLLMTTGGSTFDEVVARVGLSPQDVAFTLSGLSDEKFLRVKGPETIEAFSALVKNVSNEDGYDVAKVDAQRSFVLKEILERRQSFRETTVSPSLKAYIRLIR